MCFRYEMYAWHQIYILSNENTATHFYIDVNGGPSSEQMMNSLPVLSVEESESTQGFMSTRYREFGSPF